MECIVEILDLECILEMLDLECIVEMLDVECIVEAARKDLVGVVGGDTSSGQFMMHAQV